MFLKISEFLRRNYEKIVDWMHPPKTRLEKFTTILNYQLFIVAAALLLYRANILKRLASWTLICISEGVLMIFAILLLLNVDKHHKWLLRMWPYVTLAFELAIVIAINVRDTAEEIPTVLSFLLFPVICQTAATQASIAVIAYGVTMLCINNFDGPHFLCILISVSNIFITTCLQFISIYQKCNIRDNTTTGKAYSRTKTIKFESNQTLVAKLEGKQQSISIVTPSPHTKIKRVVPLYGSSSRASEDDHYTPGRHP